MLPGFVSPEPEAGMWLGNVLGNLRPVPRHDVKPWNLEGNRWVAVVQVEPVDEPPCMTPMGHVYERVSGKSERVTEPVLLDALFRRGQHARDRATKSADEAAARALDVPRWYSERAVGVAVALAAVGRETDDIASRLFSRSFRQALVEALSEFMETTHGLPGSPMRVQPDNLETSPQQDAFAALGHFEDRRVLHDDGLATKRPRSSAVIQATWDGAVSASTALSPDALLHFSGFGQLVQPAWSQVAPLVARLGGYGPAQLTVGVFTAPDVPQSMPHLRLGAAVDPPPPPTPDSLFHGLPEYTWIRRWVTVAEPSAAMLDRLEREFHRAAGQESFEPEVEQSAPGGAT